MLTIHWFVNVFGGLASYKQRVPVDIVIPCFVKVIKEIRIRCPAISECNENMCRASETDEAALQLKSTARVLRKLIHARQEDKVTRDETVNSPTGEVAALLK